MVKLQFCNRLNWFLPVVRSPQSEWLMTMFYDKVRVVPYNGIFIGRKSIGEELKILLRLIQRYLPNENRVGQPY